MALWFLGQGVTVTATFLDANSAPITPDSVTFTVTDPLGAACTVGSPTAVSPGFYQAQVASSTVAGFYTVEVVGMVGAVEDVTLYTYEVSNSAPLVSPVDLGIYIGAAVDSARATLILNRAQQLCMSVLNPLPSGAAAVVLDVAVRAYANPTNAQSQAAAPYTVAYGAVAGGLWLTNTNTQTLRRLAGKGGAFSIDLLADYCEPALPPWDQEFGAPVVSTS